MDTVWQLIYNLLIIAFLPALCEEFLFRGCIQNMMIQQFTKKYAMVAIIITGIIFGLIHGQMQTVLPRIFLGILLGCLYYWSNSIWVSIIAHFVNNGLQVVIAYLATKKIISDDIINDDSIVPLQYGLISAGICIGLSLMIYKSKQKYQIFSTPIITELDAENDVS
jgi:membrane protease YdiL (CAAX protease family)